MGIGVNNYEYFIVSLFLFLQEFTRMKWSENENKEREKFFYCAGMRDVKETTG